VPTALPEYPAETPRPPTRRRSARPAWGIEAVTKPKKAKEKKIKTPKKNKAAPVTSDADGTQQPKGKRKVFALPFVLPWKKEKLPDIPPMESGAFTVPDLLALASADFTSRDYVVVDGVYHAYLYITGYGYTTLMGNGWLNPLIEAGEDVNISFFIRRQAKDKILSSIAKTTMINRSRMRDVEDTRQDFEELDSEFKKKKTSPLLPS
jgi:hypothetical protein